MSDVFPPPSEERGPAGQTGLRTKIGLTIIVAAALIIVGSGVWDVYRTRQMETSQLQAKASLMAERLARTLARPVWELDNENTAEIVETAMGEQEVQAILVREADGAGLLMGRMRDAGWKVVPASGAIGNGLVSAKAKIVMRPGNSAERDVGSVQVFLTRRYMEEHLNGILVETGIKTFFALIVLVLILYFSLSKLVVGPVVRIMDGLERVQRGDLNAQVPVESGDELGLLAHSFNRMSAILKNYSDSLHAGGGHMAASSTQIAGAAKELNRGAQSQLEQVLKTSSGMEEMSASIQEVSRSANQTAERASQASNLARDGSVKVKRTVEGFNAANEVIKELNQRSQEIEQVVQLIGDIAAQTNILALNAAIEAARAGEYGRGFDVVAEEIRKLAQRTTQSTVEISAMIEEILHKTEQAANLMEKGSVWANSAGDALEDIVGGITVTSDMVEIISKAATQQAMTAEDIAASLQDISEVSRKSTQASQSMAAAASDLAALAEQLSEDAAWTQREEEIGVGDALISEDEGKEGD